MIDSQQQETSGLFDDLHRRVARLQSSNEGSKSTVQDLRQVIVGMESN